MDSIQRRKVGGLQLAVACALGIAMAGCGTDRRSVVAPDHAAPSYAVAGVTAVSCDIDLTVNFGIDSSDIRAVNNVTYNFHVVGTAGSGSPSVTATAAQLPGVTLNLLSSPLAGPVPYQSSGPGSPPAPDVSTWTPPTQATVDSLAQKPLDSFCYVARDVNGIALAPAAVGSQGSGVQTLYYPNAVAATLTSDIATGLLREEVVTVNGAVARDIRYVYASASGLVYRSSMSVAAPYVVEGQTVNTLVQMAVRNVSVSTGGQ